MKCMLPAFACLALVTLACADHPLAPATSVQASHGLKGAALTPSTARAFYAAPGGSSTGDGSASQPWDLATALAQPRSVAPGDTLWVRGGTYRGDVTSNLTGTTEKPIIVRQAPGERATIDGKFSVAGSYTWYWGLEFTYSDTKRVSAIEGSDPADLPRQDKTVFVTGPFNKIINCVVHDMGDGLFSGMSAEGVEIYGSLFYNNGWIAPNQPNGHNIYLQNSGATKLVADNAVFNSFAYGVQLYGSEAATIYNIRLEGNSIFNSGGGASSQFGPSPNILMRGGDGRFGRSVITGNSLYQRNGVASAVELGSAGGTPGSDIEFSNNNVQGQALFDEMYGYRVTGNRFTSGTTPLTNGAVLVGLRLPPGSGFDIHQWTGNQYSAAATGSQEAFYTLVPSADTRTFASWRQVTGYDGAGSSYTTGALPASTRDVVVRPNRYEPGRAMVTVWNARNAATASVDLSQVLKAGDRYQVLHVYNIFGTPVTTGTYGGGSVQIPLPALRAPAPLGLPASTAPASRAFNVFIVRRM